MTQLAAGFEGPLVVLSPIAATKPLPLTARSRLLVPVNGSPQSRRAAEIAFALARATGAQVHVPVRVADRWPLAHPRCEEEAC